MDPRQKSRQAVEARKTMVNGHRHINKLLTRARSLARNGFLSEALVASEEAAILKRM